MRQLFEADDFAGLEAWFRSVLASVPYQWHANNGIAEYEGYYASVFYSCFVARDFQVEAEISASGGRADMAVRHAGRVCVFEFKTDREPPDAALAQAKEKRYAERFRRFGEPIHLIGVTFDRAMRNILAFEVEPA